MTAGAPDAGADRPSVLRDAQFLRYLVARGLSGAGNVATLVALPVLAYRISDDPGVTALVVACSAVPYFCFGLVAGALTDRWNRHRVMVVADVLSALLLLTIPLAHLLGEVTVPHVLAVALLGPTIGVFFDGAVFGAVPMLVGRARIAEANAVAWSVQNVNEVAVPALAGAVLAILHPAWLLGFDAVTFAVSVALLLGITRPLYDASRPRPPLTWRVMVGDIAEGLRFVLGHPGVRPTVLVGFAQCVSLGAYMSLSVVWIDRVLGLGTEGWRFGVTYAAWAAGGLIASVVLTRLGRRVGPLRIVLAALPVSVALGILVSRLTTWWLVAGLLVLWAVAATLVLISNVTYRQQVTPEHLLSRVNTAGRMLSWGLGWSGGAALASAVVEPLGLRTTMLAAALFGLVGLVIAWTSPLRREAGRPAVVHDDAGS